MKTKFFFFVAVVALVFAGCNTNEPENKEQNESTIQDYYWYQGQKIQLPRGDRQYILFDESLKESDKSQITSSGEAYYPAMPNLKWGITQPNAILEDTEHIYYQISSFRTKDNEDAYITHRFYVKMKSENDSTALQDMAAQYDAEIEKDGNFPLWYILRCGLYSRYNALELANIFYESGLFSAAEPEFMGIIHLD